MGESEEIVEVVDSTPSWRHKGRVIVAASLVSVAPLVVGVMALAVGDEPAAVMAATATSLTAITDPPETTTTSLTTSTSTASTTTSTTTATTTAPPATPAPTQPPAPPSTAPLPPLSVSIAFEFLPEMCAEGAACYYFNPTIVGISGDFALQCKGSREATGTHYLSTLYVTSLRGYCWAKDGYEADIWVSVEWNGQVANSNVIHVSAEAP